MFNFLASKHRQPPEYRPHEEDDEEGQLRTARSDRGHQRIISINSLDLAVLK